MDERQLLSVNIKSNVTRLFKDFLSILTDLQQDNLRIIAEEMKQFPPEFAAKLNILDFVRYSQLRKRILDLGNGCIRDIDGYLDYFEIEFKETNKNKE